MATISEKGERAFKNLMEGGEIRAADLYQYLELLANFPARVRQAGGIARAQQRAHEQIAQLVELVIKQTNK